MMFRGRVMFARARGRTLRRMDRNAQLGETFLPRPGRLRGGLPPLPVTETGRPRLRAVPGGRTTAAARPHGGPVRPPVRPEAVADDPVDDTPDRPTDAADGTADGPGDDTSTRWADRPGATTSGSVLPPRPERSVHDWDDGPPVRAERRPVVPVWLRDPGPTVRWWLASGAHVAAFHALRVHVYVARAVAWTPRGLLRAAVGLWRWCTDAEGRDLRWWAVESQDVLGYLHLSRQRNDRVRARGAAAVVLVALALAAAVVGWTDPAGRVFVLIGVVALGGWFGRPADRPLFDHPVVAPSGVRITPDLLVEAFCAAKLCNKHEDPDRHQTITFRTPVHRDGKGWRAVLDLPGGHTASKALKGRESIAAGLGIDEVRVFLDRVRGDDGSARRVTMWVADRDPYAAAATVSPLAKAQRWTFWDGVPFGTDARGGRVVIPMVFTNLLVGAIPRMGKTYAARIPVAAAALDPHVRVIVFDAKGPDWRIFADVAHRCGFGPRDAVVEHLVEVLTECNADVDRRYDTLGTLPPDVCPESKVTPGICANRRLDMPLVLIAIDEVQEYLGHPAHGERILDLLTRLCKVAPAVGYMLVIATQRPDGDVIKPTLRDNIGTRFALKTMTWQSSETILGAGSLKAGLDSSKFQRSHKGVGLLVGADDGDLADEGPQTVRSDLLDRAALEDIVRRGRALRAAAGTLTGAAAGEQLLDERPVRSILDDVAATFAAGEHKLWSETICARLAQDHPDIYGGWGPVELAAALGPHGVDTAQVWAKDDAGKGRNRRGVDRQHVLAALAGRTNSPAPRTPAGPGGAPSGPGRLAPDSARSSTPASGPELGTSDLADPTPGRDTPARGDSAGGALDAQAPETDRPGDDRP
jgi:S-DNA-T family DNA segregation ATPase FtsK/SpoIIIE